MTNHLDRKSVERNKTTPLCEELAQISPTRYESSDIFPFLNLPAEIRNNIYHLALRSIPRDVGAKMKSHIPFMGLTQVCQGTQKEFRPWWLTQHIISIEGACKYIKAFKLTTETDVDPKARLLGENTLNLSSMYRFYGFPKHDILPLLRLLTRHSIDVTVCFLGNIDHRIKPLERLLSVRNEYWLAFITGEDIVKIHAEPPQADRVMAQVIMCSPRVSSYAKVKRISGWKVTGVHLLAVVTWKK